MYNGRIAPVKMQSTHVSMYAGELMNESQSGFNVSFANISTDNLTVQTELWKCRNKGWKTEGWKIIKTAKICAEAVAC